MAAEPPQKDNPDVPPKGNSDVTAKGNPDAKPKDIPEVAGADDWPELVSDVDPKAPKPKPKKKKCCSREKKPKQPKPESIRFCEIYKYADRKQRCIGLTGMFFACLSGLIMPTMSIVMGRAVALFNPQSTDDERWTNATELVIIAASIASTTWIFGYFQYAFMQNFAESLAFSLRMKYLKALMKQEIGYFDGQQIEALPAQMHTWFT